MIKLEKCQTMGWEPTVRGMRNPMNSWDRSDSEYLPSICNFVLGPNDFDLMKRLGKAGRVDAKFRRMITVYVDITAPLYWWKEFDTYKVGTVANSCSTMHKIHAKEFTLGDFSTEHLISNEPVTVFENGTEFPYYFESSGQQFNASYLDILAVTMEALNAARKKFLETKDKKYWWQMIQLLPTSYNQKRTVMLNYEVLANIYQHRCNHKLDEWRTLCHWIERLPYSEIITTND